MMNHYVKYPCHNNFVENHSSCIPIGRGQFIGRWYFSHANQNWLERICACSRRYYSHKRDYVTKRHCHRISHPCTSITFWSALFFRKRARNFLSIPSYYMQFNFALRCVNRIFKRHLYYLISIITVSHRASVVYDFILSLCHGTLDLKTRHH